MVPTRLLCTFLSRQKRRLADWQDEDILAALVRKDDAALSELHWRYSGIAYRLAARHNRADKEECIDDAFFFVWQYAHCYQRSILSAKLWIVGMLDRSLAKTSPDSEGESQ